MQAEKSIVIAMIAESIGTAQNICTYTYGFMIYRIEYDAAAQNYISDKLATINLVGQLAAVPLNLALALILMKGAKVWRLMLLCALLSKLSSSVFVFESKKFSPGELGPG